MGETFQQLLGSLRAAVTRCDLEAIQCADNELRKQIESFAGQADELTLRRELEAVREQHLKLIEQTEELRQKIAGQFRDVRRSDRASRIYRQMMDTTAG